jgi:signal transduction histidine kinase
MNERLIISNAKAEESEKLKTSFLANISHEVRTPLNAIMGFSNLLLDPSRTANDVERYLRIIVQCSDKLLTIIDDIIDVSKIETGQIMLTDELVNITKLMTELYEEYSPKAELKNLQFKVSNSKLTDIIKMKSDEKRLKQIITNLLDNALKFTKAGNVEFGFHEMEHFVEFYVKDTGIGIASENQELIFKRFRQVDPMIHEITSGNGLGLSIAKALLEKMGGTITVASELDKGSLFTIIIPHNK